MIFYSWTHSTSYQNRIRRQPLPLVLVPCLGVCRSFSSHQKKQVKGHGCTLLNGVTQRHSGHCLWREGRGQRRSPRAKENIASGLDAAPLPAPLSRPTGGKRTQTGKKKTPKPNQTTINEVGRGKEKGKTQEGKSLKPTPATAGRVGTGYDQTHWFPTVGKAKPKIPPRGERPSRTLLKYAPQVKGWFPSSGSAEPDRVLAAGWCFWGRWPSRATPLEQRPSTANSLRSLRVAGHEIRVCYRSGSLTGVWNSAPALSWPQNRHINHQRSRICLSYWLCNWKLHDSFVQFYEDTMSIFHIDINRWNMIPFLNSLLHRSIKGFLSIIF